MSLIIDGKKYYWTLEFCRKAHISRSTLLRWFEKGILKEPIRDRRGWRVFSDEDLRRIRVETNWTVGRRDNSSSKHRGANENISWHIHQGEYYPTDNTSHIDRDD